MYFQTTLILLSTFCVCQLPLTDKFDYLTHGDADSWKLYPFCTDQTQLSTVTHRHQ